MTAQQSTSFGWGGAHTHRATSGPVTPHKFADRLSWHHRSGQDEEETSKPLSSYTIDVDNDITYVNRSEIDQLIVGYLIRVTSEPRLPAKLTLYDASPRLLAEHQIAIGRHRKQNTVVIADKSVSREHAIIVRRDEALFIRDKASTAGTLLNWKRLKTDDEQPLQHNDILAFGETVYEFRIPNAELIEE